MILKCNNMDVHIYLISKLWFLWYNSGFRDVFYDMVKETCSGGVRYLSSFKQESTFNLLRGVRVQEH